MAITQFGDFKIVEGDEHNNDFVLTDLQENVYLGFTEEELPDLEIVLERLKGKLDG